MTASHPGNPAAGDAGGRRALLMVWDGLRPDFVTEELTPNLYRLAAEGVRFAASHAVYPTVTRVNAPSIMTGVLPGKHGIPNNLFYAPEAVEGGRLNTGDSRQLEALRPGRDGRILLRPTLGEVVSASGGHTAIVSTGSPGSALLLHPQAAVCGDTLLHPVNQSGMTLAQVEERIGPMPARTVPNSEQNAWSTRAITDVLLPELSPRLLAFWHTDPDGTQHAHGLGHPLALGSLRDADTNLGAILAALDRLGLRAVTDIIITSDHGFSTATNVTDFPAELRRLGALHDGDGVTVVPDMIYQQRHDPEQTAALVEALLQMEACGPIFTGLHGGPVVPGTLSLGLIGSDGPLAPDILHSRAWGDEENEYGVRGSFWSSIPNGKYPASHGVISTWDIRNTLIAAGPDFKRGLVSPVPAGNLDITPTLLHLLGLPALDGLDGRVLTEALAGGPDPATVAVERETVTASGRAHRMSVQFSSVNGTRYLDFGRLER